MAIDGTSSASNKYTDTSSITGINKASGDGISSGKRNSYTDTSSVKGVEIASKIPNQSPLDSIEQSPLERFVNSPSTTERLATESNSNSIQSYTEPKIAVQTDESQTSTASIVGSITEGGITFARDHVDSTGRQAAMNILTKGNAGNLPAEGFANRASLAREISSPFVNSAQALEITPFSSNAVSTQELAQTAQKVKLIGRVASVSGNVAGPLVGAFEGYKQVPLDASLGERIANSIGGGLKEVDDTIISTGAGTIAGGMNMLGAAALGTGGVTAPIVPYVVAATPAVSTAAAIGASSAYDGRGPDRAFDNVVDNYVEPFMAKAIDKSISTYNSTKSWFENIGNALK